MGDALGPSLSPKAVAAPLSLPPGPAVEVDADTEPVDSPQSYEGPSNDYAMENEAPGPLEMTSTAPPARRSSASSASSNVVTEGEVRELAAYGRPEPGLLGTVRYFLKVRKRRLELLEEQRRRTADASAAAAHKRRLLSRFGQEAHSLGIRSRSIAASLEHAVEASADLSALQDKVSGFASDHRTRVTQLERERASLEELCRPLREAETEAKTDQEQLAKTKRGIEVQKKRAEIELRNLDEGIARKQQAYADAEKPREEKDLILRDIATFDNQRPAVLARLTAHDQELESLTAPLAAAELRLSEIRGKLSLKLEQVANLNADISRLSERFSSVQGEASHEIARAQDKTDELWAAIGQRLLEEKLDAPALVEAREVAAAAAKEATASLTRRMLVDRAVDAFDKPTVEKAKKLLLATGLGAVALLVLIILGMAL